MDFNKFSKIAESLRQYRRAELKDFETEIGAKPVDLLYVDPLPGDAVLQSILASNTTYLLGRKWASGTLSLCQLALHNILKIRWHMEEKEINRVRT